MSQPVTQPPPPERQPHPAPPPTQPYAAVQPGQPDPAGSAETMQVPPPHPAPGHPAPAQPDPSRGGGLYGATPRYAPPPAAPQYAPTPQPAPPPSAFQPAAPPPAAPPPAAPPPAATPPAATPPAAPQYAPPVPRIATTPPPSVFAAPRAQPAAQPATPARATATDATALADTAGTVALPRQTRPPTAQPVTTAPGSPPAGTVWTSQHSRRASRRRTLSRQLHRLRIGWHLAGPETLRQLRGDSAGTGLILGVDQRRAPVTIRFFRPEPTRVTLVGGVWAQRLIAFRALSLGARVVIMSSHAAAWQGFGEWATGRADRVVLWTDPRPPVVPASAEAPVLVIHELEAYGFAPLPERTAWQTQLVAVHRLGPENAATLTDCNLLIMQRLTAAEAGIAVPTLGLPAQSGQLLQAMTDDMLALLGGGADRYAWLTPTATELQYHGAPRR